MSFPTKTDPYGLADGTNLVAVGVNENASASNLEITGQNGALVLSEKFGDTTAPSVECKVANTVEWAADAKALGTVTTWNSKKVALESITINTSGGAEATVTISGKEVQSGAATGCTFKIPALTLRAVHHAQILFSAFTFEGTGVHLTAANYTISGTINLTTKDGAVIAFDIVNGKIEAALTFRKLGSADPTVTPGEGWAVQAPLTESSPDSDYPTLTMTLRKILTKTEAA